MRIWVDTGGTFTDGLAVSADGKERRVKILSSSALRGTVVERLPSGKLRIRENWNAVAGIVDGFAFRVLGRRHARLEVVRHDPESQTLELSDAVPEHVTAGTAFEVQSREEAPVLAARLLTDTPSNAPLPQARMRLATTLGTNALLQRNGDPTALFITRGFADLLRIGTQQRPELFALEVRKPQPLYQDVVEVDERLAADGSVLRALDDRTLADLEPAARALTARGVRAAAVALLHAYRDPSHERRLAERLRSWGFEHVTCSVDVAPRIKLLPRAETAVVDAYLSATVSTYLDRVRASLGGANADRDDALLVMTSAGGLLTPDGFRPKDSLLSGPAGGVVGAARAGALAGLRQVIGLDMGGTSTDVARYDGDYEYVFEHQVGDAHLVAPALAIETVAAGGGSVCWLDGERLRVGPRSAGATPGPACYGAGGPLTLTDVNVLLGRLLPDRFGIPIDLEPARKQCEHLLDELAGRTGRRDAPDAILEGLLAIADETMADAIRAISLRRGYDPSDHSLVAFGGAGGQHACGVAERLRIRRVIVPRDAALLSALGLGHAVIERFVERQVLEPLDSVADGIAELLQPLEAEAIRQVESAGVSRDDIAVRRRLLHLRFVGQDATVDVDWSDGTDVERAFSDRYVELFGDRPENRPVELESVRVVASSPPQSVPVSSEPQADHDAPSTGQVEAVFHGKRRQVPSYDRETLRQGAVVRGPAIVFEPHSTTVVAPDWNLLVHGDGTLVLRRATRSAVEAQEQPEAVRLELFTQRFHTLVGEMGERLERTAISTNVKERLDFSCALLDPHGELVVNAPHIPVHLGALGLCVRTLKRHMSMEEGHVVVTNHPGYGGSHLPDVTVVTPAHSETGKRLGYVASRAHHAEIGGVRPGSMPPNARRLGEEGVVLPPTYLMNSLEGPDGGDAGWKAVTRLLTSGPYPTRNLEDNLADLRAAVAANHAGVRALRALAATHGDDTVLRYMVELEQLAETRMREALTALADGVYTAEERLDDGTRLKARIELAGDTAHVSFAGSGGVHPGNLNATPAIVRSVVLYVFRLLLRGPLPLNEGLLRPVTIDVPAGILNPEFPDDPMRAPAVVGGNVETSQRLTDTLLKALQLVACSQGTMNNTIFGNDEYGYYETIAGGAGAGVGFDGASGVQVHMTNTRMTDPEILEHRYPVRLIRFGIREGSGGAGLYRGGDGLIREIEFLAPVELSMLTQHRVERPYGLAGGEPGDVGRQYVVRKNGDEVPLASIDGCSVEAGDRLVVETPGGGGHGAVRRG